MSPVRRRATRLALVGCGAIGRTLLSLLKAGAVPGAEIVALVDLEPERAQAAAASADPVAKVLPLAEAVAQADLVIEAAGSQAVAEVFACTLPAKRRTLVMSVGAFVARPDLLDQAKRVGMPVMLPSGAIVGLDGLKAAMVGGVSRVRVTTTKPPAGLAGAPWVQERGWRLETLKEPTYIFEGSAREAIRGFPANVNVCVTVALAGVGLDRTEIRVEADPASTRNRHRLEVEGAFGRFEAVTENLPVDGHPKTSALAAYAAAASLRALLSPVGIGTP